MGDTMAGSARANHNRSAAMDKTGSTVSFKRFALALYGSEGVADACLHLQNRHDLDVNIVLFAAFVGAVRRQALTNADVDLAKRRVDPWHQEVVRPLRAVRQRLKTGPLPAPNDATGSLRRKLAQLEIEAEVIELDQLGELIPEVRSPHCTGSAVECAAAAIETVIRTYTGAALNDQDREAIDTIATEAHHSTQVDKTGRVQAPSDQDGLVVSTSAPSSVMWTVSRRNTAPTPSCHT
jgi:uncharacterized protein (TIGR02444 family)